MTQLLLLLSLACGLFLLESNAFRHGKLPIYRQNSNPTTSSALEMKNSPVQDKLKLLKSLRPIIGFYALMLAPIYGTGSPIGFFGSMTDFSTLKNRGIPGMLTNEYIVAPKGFSSARTDDQPPTFPVSADKLGEAITKVVLRQPRITTVARDDETMRQGFVFRSLIFRFPDVVTFQSIPLGKDQSTLAVHSYSIYGGSDLGVNGNRVRLLIGELESELNK
jgi:uncharacterized protein (DUF1499 family)